MKAVLLLLALCPLLPAKTWIELAREADYHLDHPGNNSRLADDHPSRREYLTLNAETLGHLISGQTAKIPMPSASEQKNFEPEFLKAITNLSSLLRLQIKEGSLAKAETTLQLFGKVRERILDSDPNLLWFQVAHLGTRTCFNSLSELGKIKSVTTREELFKMLRAYWEETKVRKGTFLLTETGESKTASFQAGTIPSLIRSYGSLDSEPIILDPDFKPKLTVREILALPFDSEKAKAEAINQTRQSYGLIRQGAKLDELLEKENRPHSRSRAFYESHHNGLWQYALNGFGFCRYPTFFLEIQRSNLLDQITIQWISLEADGVSLEKNEDLIERLPPDLKDRIKESKIEINLSQRMLTDPKIRILEKSIPLTRTVPNLFPN